MIDEPVSRGTLSMYRTGSIGVIREGFPEELLRCGSISIRREKEINGVSLGIHSAI